MHFFHIINEGGTADRIYSPFTQVRGVFLYYDAPAVDRQKDQYEEEEHESES